MAHKYQTFADLLYASYSGLQTLGFAFAKGKKIGGRVVLVALMSCFVLDRSRAVLAESVFNRCPCH